MNNLESTGILSIILLIIGSISIGFGFALRDYFSKKSKPVCFMYVYQTEDKSTYLSSEEPIYWESLGIWKNSYGDRCILCPSLDRSIKSYAIDEVSPIIQKLNKEKEVIK
jgi:hypothetical protein